MFSPNHSKLGSSFSKQTLHKVEHSLSGDYKTQEKLCQSARPRTITSSMINNQMKQITQSYYKSSSKWTSSVDDKETLMQIKNVIIKEKLYTNYFENLSNLSRDVISSKSQLKKIYTECKTMKKLIPAFQLKSHKEIFIDVLKITEMEIMGKSGGNNSDGPDLMRAVSQVSDLSNSKGNSSITKFKPEQKFSSKTLQNISDLSIPVQEEFKEEEDNSVSIDSEVQLLEKAAKQFNDKIFKTQQEHLYTITEYSEEELNNIKLENPMVYKDELNKYAKLLVTQTKKKNTHKVVAVLKSGIASIPLALRTLKYLGLSLMFGVPALIFTADVFIVWRLKRQGKINTPAMVNAIIAKFGKHLISSVVAIGSGLLVGLVCTFFLPGIGTLIGALLAAFAAGTITDILIEKHIKQFIQSEIKPEQYSKQYKLALVKLGFTKKEVKDKNIEKITDDMIQKKFKKQLRMLDPEEEDEKKKKENDVEIIKLVVALEIINIHREELKKLQMPSANDVMESMSFDSDEQKTARFSSYEMNDEYLASYVIKMK